MMVTRCATLVIHFVTHFRSNCARSVSHAACRGTFGEGGLPRWGAQAVRLGAMDASTATLLAAALSALVAAGTFAAAEVIKIRTARSDRMASALGAVLDELSRVPQMATRPRIFERRNDLEIGTAVMHLFAAVPFRDRWLVYWLAQRLFESTAAPLMDRVRISAEMTGKILAWKVKPREVRRSLEREVRRSSHWSNMTDGQPPFGSIGKP